MTLFAKIHLINHGLDQTDVGQVFHWREDKLQKVSSDEMTSKMYGDWTMISAIVDADNFECFSGEDTVLDMSTNLFKKDERKVYSITMTAQQYLYLCKLVFSYKDSCSHHVECREKLGDVIVAVVTAKCNEIE